MLSPRKIQGLEDLGLVSAWVQPVDEVIDWEDPELLATLAAEREALAKQLDEHATLRERAHELEAEEEAARVAEYEALPASEKVNLWMHDWADSVRAWYTVLSVDTKVVRRPEPST